MDKDFLYDPLLDDELLGDQLMTSAVARIRAKENTLLTDQDLKSLMACPTYSECIQYLLDRGWGPMEHVTPEELLALEKDRMWELIGSLLTAQDAKVFDIFRLSSDFHNLKAAIKESYIQKTVPDVYMEGGTIDVQTLRRCAADADFSALPLVMMRAAEEARDVLFRAGDSQLCDVIIDKACLDSIQKAAEESGNSLLKEYAEFKCAAANINIAIRACRAGKDEEFLKKAFARCSSISTQKLLGSARNGIDAIYEYLEQTVYKDAADAIKESPAAFDRWCDNRMIELIRPQKYNAFTISPLAAYVLAKECEIKSVRLILSGKLNHLPEEKIRERLRESYV